MCRKSVKRHWERQKVMKNDVKMFFEKFRQIILSISICTFGCHKPYFCQVYRFLTRIAHLKVSWSRFSQFRFVKMSSCVPPHEPVFHHFSSPHFLWFSSRLFDKFYQISISSFSSFYSFSKFFFSFILFHLFSFRPKFSKFFKTATGKMHLIPLGSKDPRGRSQRSCSLHVPPPYRNHPLIPACSHARHFRWHFRCHFHKSSYVVIIG